ncbi:MAG: acyl-CoA dehydrogenase family protein [Betaproteobacteria bacterium]
MTPIVKAFGTQQGFEGAHRALQVFGGYGYVRETGVEQTLRDARIAMIYEGTNEIQAIDLVQRKLLGDEGRALQILLAEFEAEAQAAHGAGVPDLAAALRKQIEHAQEGLRGLQVAARAGREAVLALCDEALAAYAHLCQAWAWTASARACAQLLAQTPEDAQARARLERMRYGVQWLLPQAQVHWQALQTARPLPLEVG